MSFNKTIQKLLKKIIMSDYNEKQLAIATEYRKKQQENVSNYNSLRKKHLEAIEENYRTFQANKTQLAIELQDILNTRAELRRKGMNNFSEEIQNSFADEIAIHEKQRNNRNEFFEKERAHKRAIAELHNACCGTSAYLKNQEIELLAAVEKEYKQTKTQENE